MRRNGIIALVAFLLALALLNWSQERLFGLKLSYADSRLMITLVLVAGVLLAERFSRSGKK